jgi:hypothetical protein
MTLGLRSYIDDHLAAESEDRKAQHAGGVGEGCEREAIAAAMASKTGW